MAGSLLPAPKQQFFSDIGIPLFAGKIYTYAAGTLTPKATYQDQALTVTNTNPVIANARGEVVMYGSGAYRVILKDALENTIYDRDNITINDFASANGSESIGNGGETVAQSFNALQLADYGALRAYVGPRKSVYVTGYLVSASPSGIAGTFVPDLSDTTSADNGGTIIVAANNVRWKRQYTGGVDIRWWGAKFDADVTGLTGTDDTAAVQACCDYAVPLQKEILLPAGSSRITAPIILNFSSFGLNMTGQGFQKTKFLYPTLALGLSLFSCTGYPGATSGGLVRGIGFNGNSGTNAFALVGANGQVFDNCQFGANSFALFLLNGTTGTFTEHNVLRNCDLLLSCQSAIWYFQDGSGDASFHGSGIEGGIINNNGFPVLVISPKANPYNAPFSPTIFTHANVTIIAMPIWGGIYRPNFYGTLKLEVQAGRALLCDAPEACSMAYVGKVLSQSSNVVFGTFFLCDGVFSAFGGTRQMIGARVSRRYPLTTGTNTLPIVPYNIMESAVFVSINILGPNYDYRTVHTSWGALNGGQMVLVGTLAQFNASGWGSPTITINSQSQIVITNANYPASGVTVLVDIFQIGQSPFSPFIP